MWFWVYDKRYQKWDVVFKDGDRWELMGGDEGADDAYIQDRFIVVEKIHPPAVLQCPYVYLSDDGETIYNCMGSFNHYERHIPYGGGQIAQERWYPKELPR